jgi:hypothetical protein
MALREISGGAALIAGERAQGPFCGNPLEVTPCSSDQASFDERRVQFLRKPPACTI